MPNKSQLNLPPSLLANQTLREDVRPEDTHPVDDPQAKAARVLNAAFKDSGRSSAEAAFCLKVSESLVNRWRSPDARESISSLQLFKLYRDLGPWFTYQYHVANHRENKLAKVALREAVQSLSLLAVGLE